MGQGNSVNLEELRKSTDEYLSAVDKRRDASSANLASPLSGSEMQAVEDTIQKRRDSVRLKLTSAVEALSAKTDGVLQREFFTSTENGIFFYLDNLHRMETAIKQQVAQAVDAMFKQEKYSVDAEGQEMDSPKSVRHVTNFSVLLLKENHHILDKMMDLMFNSASVEITATMICYMCVIDGAVKLMLDRGYPMKLMELGRNRKFDLSSQAFATLHNLMMAKPKIAAEWLSDDDIYVKFMCQWLKCVDQSENYVAQREVMSLMQEMFHEPEFYLPFTSVMMTEVSWWKLISDFFAYTDGQALKESCFHILKFYVALDSKLLHPEVKEIIRENHKKLAKHFDEFLLARQADQYYIYERKMLMPAFHRKFGDLKLQATGLSPDLNPQEEPPHDPTYP
uniref:Uncharacterized protein n=1 Tax=Chromera velia CCMP2878 TaxID=1169474 RepID=A0A0G4FIS5_9ALVE|mmetsp:Transcript_8468/g.16494  ORF Transcript_8468/g.16494 Transcript_8468/m.16494 type:complete len:394 (-) Transcript_8468:195-1376(-)|eukprot:Cvel_3386.t1-p1 / transcript=Cvel_3386.t1 / gene=Cvel_3386 / organism=Chromera_velia_CCMP2878 / gene_product=Protein Mo25, putative / transcript_product=Protein Mo25, putative / location=Cvel_scaffold136:63461-68131(-) / protein_length=393 / sequence_SO=supercontig / SO=protein_coding / is_pseudo=false